MLNNYLEWDAATLKRQFMVTALLYYLVWEHSTPTEFSEWRPARGWPVVMEIVSSELKEKERAPQIQQQELQYQLLQAQVQGILEEIRQLTAEIRQLQPPGPVGQVQEPVDFENIIELPWVLRNGHHVPDQEF